MNHQITFCLQSFQLPVCSMSKPLIIFAQTTSNPKHLLSLCARALRYCSPRQRPARSMFICPSHLLSISTQQQHQPLVSNNKQPSLTSIKPQQKRASRMATTTPAAASSTPSADDYNQRWVSIWNAGLQKGQVSLCLHMVWRAYTTRRSAARPRNRAQPPSPHPLTSPCRAHSLCLNNNRQPQLAPTFLHHSTPAIRQGPLLPSAAAPPRHWLTCCQGQENTGARLWVRKLSSN